jgi:hypothetical protein
VFLPVMRRLPGLFSALVAANVLLYGKKSV